MTQGNNWETLKNVRVTPEQFEQWVLDAKPGEEINYHNGSNLMAPDPANPAIFTRIAVGASAYKAAVAGTVFLYRRRIDPTRFSWIARRVSKETGKRIKPEVY